VTDSRPAVQFPQHRHIPPDGGRRRAAARLTTVSRGRVVTVALALPLLAAALAACGDDGNNASGGGLSDAAKHGQQLARSQGCSACHGAAGEGGVGPAWQGLLGSTVTLTDGSTVTADEAYLTRAIKDPQAQVVDGFSVSMPVNQLSDQDIADLVAYISTLGKGG
jgi:cytochrome c oxidase subunit II